MDAGGIRKAARGDRARKPRRRRSFGIKVAERDGFWHVHATVRGAGRSIRLRKSLGLAVKDYSAEQAEQAGRDLVDETRARLEGRIGRGDPVEIAALGYLSAARERPLTAAGINITKKITARFRGRRLNEIGDLEWREWIDGRPGGAAGLSQHWRSSTRERFLNGVVAFLNFARRHHGLARLPEFQRDRKATNPNRRARRRVEDLRPELIGLLFVHAHIATRAQLALEVDTGARVSSVLHGARLCDLNLAAGRETIIYRQTKTGHDVVAALGPSAAQIMRDYIAWRGDLYDREAPLFVTPDKRQPYTRNGLSGQNRTAFGNTRRRAARALRRLAAAIARRLRHADRALARDAIAMARADAALLERVTQHWFRHRLATLWIRRSPRAAMDQGGWRDVRSMMGYAHDSPEFRRQVAGELDPFKPAAAGGGRS